MKRRFPHKENVLLVNITRLGDMLQATPTIAGMKMENPNCKITVVVEKQFEDVCHIIPNIDTVIPIDLTFVSRALAAEGEAIVDAYEYLSAFIEDLKSRNFDYCLNMSSSPYTALLLRILNIPRSGGWSSDEEGFRIIESDWARLFATSVFHQNRQFNSLNLVDVFRASADVEQHPFTLLLNVPAEAQKIAQNRIAGAGFTNSGPLVAVQAGASQSKRQWEPDKFVAMGRELIDQSNARLVFCGSTKELPIINEIIQKLNSPNAVSFGGKTTIPELAAILGECDVLVTGDTGPMHISVAVGTPVISLFLASAFGFETGPYSDGNIVIQPVIGCGPCNPNKACLKTDCHDHVDPHAVATLAIMRAQGDISTVPAGLIDPQKAIIYRTCFDEFGFYDLKALNLLQGATDPFERARVSYRKLWLEEIGGMKPTQAVNQPAKRQTSILETRADASELKGLLEVITVAHDGKETAAKLRNAVLDQYAPSSELRLLSSKLGQIDRDIEEKGLHFGPLGPITRMFLFAKENIVGTDPAELASQMERIYEDLERRGRKFAEYVNDTTN
jgi:ADP-heptose:LPS heptosyltransferase